MQFVSEIFNNAWSIFFGPAPIDWCEENYAFDIFHIAEFHNTWTNIFYIIFGCLAYQRAENLYLSYYFKFFSASLILTGITSAIFHATLIWGGQKLDETFETFTLLGLLYAAIDQTNEKKHFFILHCILAFLGIWLVPIIFCEVHLALLAIFTMKTYLNQFIKKEENKKVQRAALLAVLGFVAWIIDQTPIGCQLVGKIHLHAYIWHTLTAISLHETGILANVLELRNKLKNSTQNEKYDKISIKNNIFFLSDIELK